VTVTGNVKFDIVAPAQQLELGRELSPVAATGRFGWRPARAKARKR
jgi:hypothetical protein